MPLQGQITLTESNTPHSPNLNDERLLSYTPVINFELEGENIQYDFGSIAPEFMYTDEYFSAVRPEFADATRYFISRSVFGPLDLFSEYHTRKTSDGIAEVGTYKLEQSLSLGPLSGNPDDQLVFSGNATVFPVPNYELPFPTNYGDTWTTNTEIVFDLNVSIAAFGLDNVPGRAVSYLEHQYEAAGWGKVTVPTLAGPSIPYDVLVIKHGTTFIDSIFLGGAPAPAALLSGLGLTQGAQGIQNSYYFYAENIENPLMLLVMSDDWQTIEEVQYPRNGLQVASPYTYVDADATGANNGTSWANAYTSLSTALDNAEPNEEIWVAEGTYTPEVPAVSPDPTKRMFLLWQDVQLYGGFNGTETNRSQRNPSLYETILSGDINGDDVSNNFSINRSDNVENVVYGNNTISAACVLDGFTVSGGHADGDPSILTDIRGAGLFTFGPLQLSNCILKDNFAQDHGGGAYYRTADAAGGKVVGCRFQRNEAGMNGGGLFVAFVPGNGVEIDSCQFSENIAGDTGGGFTSVEAHINFKNSFFTNNTAIIGVGGGMSLSNGLNPILSNCAFSGNSSTQGGGAVITLLTANQSATVENCIFNGNTSTAGSGGGLTCQSSVQNNNYQINGCTFIGNTAESGISTGAGLDVVYGNFASGGTSIITDCTIMNNTVSGSGGGLSLRDQAGDNQLEVRNCEISGNSAESNAGGLLFFKATTSNSTIRISQTTFSNNDSPQALGIGMASVAGFVPGLDVSIDNCLFAGHSGPNNASAVVVAQAVPVTLTNCTVTGSSPAIIAADQAAITLQNNILYTPDFTSVLAASASATLTSLGGNLFSDSAASAWAVAQDQQDADPLFVVGTTDLSETSPAVDRGILPDDVADLDVKGSARVQGSCIDIGATESAFDANLTSCLMLTSTKEDIIVPPTAVTIFPNPVSTTGQIKLDNDWRGNISLRIVNTFGQTIQDYTITKHNDTDNWDLNTQNLLDGTYQLILSNGQHLMTKSFIVIK